MRFETSGCSISQFADWEKILPDVPMCGWEKILPIHAIQIGGFGPCNRAASVDTRPFRRVSEDELSISASSADVRMLPIPTEPWMDIAVVTGDASKIQSHSSEKHEPQNQEDRNRVT